MSKYATLNFALLTMLGSTPAWGIDLPPPKDHPGLAVYDKHCAACHDNPEQSKARSFDTLTRMIPTLIEYALTDGRMKAQGNLLSAGERADLIGFLSGQVAQDIDWIEQAMCPADRQTVDTKAYATISTFGLGLENHRYLSALEAGLSKDDMSNLELSWAFAFPNITMMRSQPAVVGDTLFITPVDSKQLYALDVSGKPCIKWIYTAELALRTSLTYGRLPKSDRYGLVFGDMSGRVHMVDARTGQLIWLKDLRLFPETIITGTPQLVDGRVYASISQFEIMVGATPSHKCCTTHGAVAALEAETGETIWLTPTLPDAKPVRDRGDGQMIWGPSGAPVWTSPAIDTKRGVLYVGTGEATSDPAHKHTDAILALDLSNGSIKWSFQATANDIYLSSCRRDNSSLNCPGETSVERDVDFGASVIIAAMSDGREILLAGQKSSDVWALDPDNEGQLLWHWNNGQGTAIGGIHWGMAFDGEKLYTGISDPGQSRDDYEPRPGIYAIDVNSGDLVWSRPATPTCAGRKEKLPSCGFLFGYSAATLAVGETIVQGSLDGYVRIFDSANGALIFSYDTVGEYAGINGVTGFGGAIDNASIVAADGTLYVSSGYGMFGQEPGNVLLAFKPRKKPQVE